MKKYIRSEKSFIEKFLIRPRRIQGESNNGFLWRVFEENGFRNPAKICNALTQKKPTKDDTTEISTLKTILSLDEFEFYSISKNVPAISIEASSQSNSFLGSLFEHSVVKEGRRICTQCQSENLYHRELWQLSWYIICHEHGIWITTECDSCGIGLSWDSGSLQYCSCGYNLHNSIIKKIDQSTVDLYLCLLSSRFSHDVQTSSSEDVASLEMKYVIAIQVLSGIHLDNVSINTSIFKVKPLANQQKLLVSAGKNYENWPSNFYETLKHAHQIKIHHHWKGIAIEAPPLEWEYIESLTTSKILPEFIVEAVKQFIETHRAPPTWRDLYFYPPSESVREDEKVNTTYFCSYSETVALLEISKGEFNFLIDSKLLPSKEAYLNGRLYKFVPRYLVEDAFKFYESTLPLSEAALELGLSVSDLESLIKYKLINLALGKRNECYRRIKKVDIAKFITNLEAIAHPVEPAVDPEIGYSLSDLWRIICMNTGKAEFGMTIKLLMCHRAKFGIGCSKSKIFDRLVITRTTWRQILALFPFIKKDRYDQQIGFARLACSCINGNQQCWRDVQFRLATHTQLMKHTANIHDERTKAIKALPVWLQNRRPSPFEPLSED
jgi:hypothetical protein